MFKVWMGKTNKILFGVINNYLKLIIDGIVVQFCLSYRWSVEICLKPSILKHVRFAHYWFNLHWGPSRNFCTMHKERSKKWYATEVKLTQEQESWNFLVSSLNTFEMLDSIFAEYLRPFKNNQEYLRSSDHSRSYVLLHRVCIPSQGKLEQRQI